MVKKESQEIQKKIFTAEFKEFCHKNFRPQMEKLEKTRIYYILGIIFVTIIFFALIAFLLIWSKFDTDAFEVYVPLIALVIFIDTFICKSYKNKAKKIILKKLLSFIGEFKIIKNSSGISYIKCLDLFDTFNSHSIDDRIKGNYGSLELDITEMHLKYISGSGKNRSERTVFKGVLTVVPSNKKFKGTTIIKKQSLINLGKSGLEKVNLEDPEFERIFEVFSTDQIEARYLITAAFMQRMVQLCKKSQSITVSFEQDNVNIAISSSKDWFEMPLMRPATDIIHYRAIILDLLTILKIIDSLKLDQNIGM